jgi:hypothetical protein
MRARRLWFGLLGTLALAGLPAPAGAQPVGEEFQVNTYTTEHQGGPAIASDAGGNFVVVWSAGPGQDGDDFGVFGQRYDSSGMPSGEEFQINSFTRGGQSGPDVACTPSGEFVVVWNGTGDGDPYFGIFGQRYDSAGVAQGGEFRINTTTSGAGRQEAPSVAVDAAGNFVVVWDCDDGYSNCGTFGQRFDAEGVPQGGEFQAGSQQSTSASVASDASGNFVVVYAVGVGIFGKRYDDEGVQRGAEFQVNTYTTHGQFDPSVASDTSGNFVVVWDSHLQDGDRFGVFGQRFDSGGVPQGGEFRVNSYTTEWQSDNAVTMDASGNFVVVWGSNEQDGDDFGVFGQRYDKAGVPQGGEFQISSYTSYEQRIPSVAITGTNAFVVVWKSDYQDGDEGGVFGRRFDFGGDTLTVVSPNTNVKWRIGSLHQIQWTHNLGLGETFRIELDRDNDGSYEEPIAAAATADSASRGSFAWTVTGPPTATARVRVAWTDNLSVSDVSDVTFQIRPVPLDASREE